MSSALRKADSVQPVHGARTRAWVARLVGKPAEPPRRTSVRTEKVVQRSSRPGGGTIEHHEPQPRSRDLVEQIDLVRDRASAAALAGITLMRQSQLHLLGSRMHQQLRKQALAAFKTASHYAAQLKALLGRRAA